MRDIRDLSQEERAILVLIKGMCEILAEHVTTEIHGPLSGFTVGLYLCSIHPEYARVVLQIIEDIAPAETLKQTREVAIGMPELAPLGR